MRTLIVIHWQMILYALDFDINSEYIILLVNYFSFLLEHGSNNNSFGNTLDFSILVKTLDGVVYNNIVNANDTILSKMKT